MPCAPLRSTPPPTTHAVVTRDLCHAVQAGAHRVVTALADGDGPRNREDWLAVVGDCQGLINVLTAVQDHAAVEVARREPVWLEDGTLGEVMHQAGRVTLDAADVVAPVLGVSHAQAQRRVDQAVRVAAGRVPVEADGEARPEQSGLGGLHAAMRAGRLDGYRAGVVAHELQECPAEVAVAVVAALDPHLDDDGPTLRRRARRMLARISPELLRQRAILARAETGLRRWVAEPGVDAWHGTFPSEDAALAWAAIDRLAHDLIAEGTCSSVEQARGRALTDLVTGHATVDVQVVLTVPADTCLPGHHSRRRDADRGRRPLSRADADHGPERQRSTARVAQSSLASVVAPRDGDLVQVQGPRPSEPLLVRRGWLWDH